MEFSQQEYWSGLPFPSPGHLPNPGTEWQGLLHCRQILYHLNHQESPLLGFIKCYFTLFNWFIWLHPVFLVIREIFRCECPLWPPSVFSNCSTEPALPAACEILVPQPGMNTWVPALGGGFLTTGPPGKSHQFSLKVSFPHYKNF